jgi:hypothetical protein
MTERIRYTCFIPGQNEAGDAVSYYTKDGILYITRSDGSVIEFHGTWKIEKVSA